MKRDEQTEIAALERMYALQSPQRPAITVLVVLDVVLTLLLAFAILFEELAVNLVSTREND
jgi:hypothetical protein